MSLFATTAAKQKQKRNQADCNTENEHPIQTLVLGKR